MSFDDLRARTAARKASGANQTYPEHAGRGRVATVAPKRVALNLVPCAHLGNRVPGQPCGSPLLRCNLHGDITTRFTACAGAQRCCATCGDDPAKRPPA